MQSPVGVTQTTSASWKKGGGAANSGGTFSPRCETPHSLERPGPSCRGPRSAVRGHCSQEPTPRNQRRPVCSEDSAQPK